MGSEFKGGEPSRWRKPEGYLPNCTELAREVWGYRFYYLYGEGGLPPLSGVVGGVVAGQWNTPSEWTSGVASLTGLGQFGKTGKCSV